MNQSQGGNPFGRLIEFAKPHKAGYIVSVVLAVMGVDYGIIPYIATARMTIYEVVFDFRWLLCLKSNIDGDFYKGIP